MIFSVLKEESPQSNQDSLDRRLLTSKLKSLNTILQNLLQKKIRIDLEIRRTKKRISKLKSQSQTLVKTHVELEGDLNYDHLSNQDLKVLQERFGEQVFSELFELDKEVFEAQQLLTEIEKLPLYEDKR